METKTITLNLTERQCGYLASAVVEFLHKMNLAREEGGLVHDLEERLEEAKSLWHQVDEVTGVGK